MRKFLVDGNEFEAAEEAVNYITENGDFDDSYNNMLDECWEEINICGFNFNPSYALKKLDSIAYRCEKNDYIDSLTYDMIKDIDRMTDGDSETFFGVDVECMEEWFKCPMCGEEYDTEEEAKECEEDCKKEL